MLKRGEKMYLDIKEFLDNKEYVMLKKEIEKEKAVDIADVFDDLDKRNSIILFRLLSKDKAADVFSNLTAQQRIDIVGAIQETKLSEILDDLFFDDMIDILEEMPANIVKKILAESSEEERKLINQFLSYCEDSAGSLMTIEYVDLKKEMTVKEALRHIKKIGIDKETIYTCYVLDRKRKLEGLVSLRKLVLSDDDLFISDIMNEDFVFTNTLNDQEVVASLFKRYDLISLPVVDNENRLVGIITIDDIVDVIEQENTEDFQKMAAMEPHEEEYLQTGIFSLARKRIVWLLFLMVSATFTGIVIRKYDEVLQSVVVLAVFIPMLMDTAGNAGSQSSTLIIRGIALGKISLNNYAKVFWKEFRVSIVVGSMLALLNFLRVLIIERVEMDIAIVVSLTLAITVIFAKLVGSMLPVIAKKLKLDPAIMAGPLITTIVDAIALIVYFNLANMFLNL